MMPSFLTFTLGPLGNNTYVVVDLDSHQAAVVDPSFGSKAVLEEIQHQGWQLNAILLTHAHYDHIAGVPCLHSTLIPPPGIYLHPADLVLYQMQGGAQQFGFHLETLPDAVLPLENQQRIPLGKHHFEVRHTPGHSPGHVIYYCAAAGAAFCGDLIFAGSVGRTDLPGGSHRQLVHSIEHNIFTLPPQTRLLCGHGPETTVAIEKETNPYL